MDAPEEAGAAPEAAGDEPVAAAGEPPAGAAEMEGLDAPPALPPPAAEIVILLMGWPAVLQPSVNANLQTPRPQ